MRKLRKFRNLLPRPRLPERGSPLTPGTGFPLSAGRTSTAHAALAAGLCTERVAVVFILVRLGASAAGYTVSFDTALGAAFLLTLTPELLLHSSAGEIRRTVHGLLAWAVG